MPTSSPGLRRSASGPASSSAWRPPGGASRTLEHAAVAQHAGARAVRCGVADQSHRSGEPMRTLVAMADDLPTGRLRRAAKVGRLAGGQTARGYATKAANLTRSEEGRRDAAERRQMEAAEQIFDVLGPDEGRGDEGRPGGLVHRHRRVPARVPGAHPGQAGRAARRRAARAVRAHAQGDRGRPRRAARRRVRRVRRGGGGRGLDRPGLPRPAARRPRRGGQGPVPGRRAGRARRPPEPGADHARGEADGARAWTRRR